MIKESYQYEESEGGEKNERSQIIGNSEFENKERDLRIRSLKIDLWVKPLSFVTFVFAFLAAYSSFDSYVKQNNKLNNEKQILEERINLSSIPINEETSLLHINVDLVNKGGQTLKPYAHQIVKNKLYKHEGMYLVVYEIQTSPNRLVDFEEGNLVYGPYNMLNKYSNNDREWYDSYRIKPHTTYHESEVVILERKKLYQVLVRFFVLSEGSEGWTITESQYIYVN